MKIFGKCRVLALAFFALSVASCWDSKNPLSDPNQSKLDKDLCGWWVNKEGGNTTILAIGRYSSYRKDLPDGIMCMRAISIDADGVPSGDKDGAPFFVSSLKGGTYMNLFDKSVFDSSIDIWDKDVIEHYALLKFQISGDKLEFRGCDDEGKAKAIESKKVLGEVKRDKDDRKSVLSAKLTDSTENLARYINDDGGGAVLFPNPGRIYVRMKTP